jgi:hypothetical protein
MSLFAVLFRTAILFCLCKTQERPCVNHSGFRIGAVFIFLLVESNAMSLLAFQLVHNSFKQTVRKLLPQTADQALKARDGEFCAF